MKFLLVRNKNLPFEILIEFFSKAKSINYPALPSERKKFQKLQQLMLIAKRMKWNDVYKHYEVRN
jgi:hypothetical protein